MSPQGPEISGRMRGRTILFQRRPQVTVAFSKRFSSLCNPMPAWRADGLGVLRNAPRRSEETGLPGAECWTNVRHIG